MGGTGFCFVLLLNLPSKNLVLPSIHWGLACFISLNLRSHTFLLYIPSYFTHFVVIVNRCFLIYVSNWLLLLEWIKTTTNLKVKVFQLWLCNPRLCNYTVHGILQARILKWVTYPFSSRDSQPPESNPGLLYCRWIFHQLSYQQSLLLVCPNPLWRRRQWHPTPVLLPGKSHGQRGLVHCSPWGR